MNRSEAISFIKECSGTHLSWYNHLGACEYCRNDNEVIAKVGNQEHHRELIEKYDGVIKLLCEDGEISA